MEFPFAGISFGGIVLLGAVAVMLFGKDLPKMGRKLGKFYADLKRGYQNVQQEVHSVIRDMEESSESSVKNEKSFKSYGTSSEPKEDEEDQVESVAPRFEPPRES
ncbi:MAG: twin-arginine translocase TatA/TatE family subunit [Planctomycetia bacterium]|nr:twin-arginine translocase TatA/TatE family subunit [Planctomycetia bacterium]